MNIQIDFTTSEKKEFLKSLGYVTSERVEQEWWQWGNHDSQGNWIDKTVVYAKKPKMSTIEHTMEEAFQKEMSEHLKKILLHGLKVEK